MSQHDDPAYAEAPEDKAWSNAPIESFRQPQESPPCETDGPARVESPGPTKDLCDAETGAGLASESEPQLAQAALSGDDTQVPPPIPPPTAEQPVRPVTLGGGAQLPLTPSQPHLESQPEREPVLTAADLGTTEEHADLAGSPEGVDGSRLEALANQLSAQLATITEQLAPLEQLHAQVGELSRLRARDADMIERLHADNGRLRTGELTTAMAPLLSGLLRLHDQMTSLAGDDKHSVAGMLRTQLVQILEVASGVVVYEPAPGVGFDATRHTGAGRAPTADPARDSTVARTLRPGFVRADGTVVRVAEVEVWRLSPTVPIPVPPAHAGTER